MAPGGGRSGAVGAGRGVHRRSPHVRAEKGRTGTAPGAEGGGFPPAPRYRCLCSGAFQSTGYPAPPGLLRGKRQDYKSQSTPRRAASSGGLAGPRGLPRFVVPRVGVEWVCHGSRAEVKMCPGRPGRQRDVEIGALRFVLRVPRPGWGPWCCAGSCLPRLPAEGMGCVAVWVLRKPSPCFFCSFSTMRMRSLLPALLSLSLALLGPGGECLVSPAWAHRAPDQ